MNRLADGELEGAARDAVRQHVSGCDRCSRVVWRLHDLSNAGRDMRHPAPPRGLLEDVLADRAAGARVILPAVASENAPRRRRLPVAAAVAATLVLAALTTVLVTSEAGAGASEVRAYPPDPVPGQRIQLRYRPRSDLAGEARLRLRIRLRTPDTAPPRGTLGAYDEVILLPTADGAYVGQYDLPADFAFGVMAVETLDGETLDDHGGRLWAIRAHDSHGLPLPAALRQEYLVLQRRSWPEAWEALHEMTALYPDLAEGWSLKLPYEASTWLPEESALARAGYRERFRQIQREAADRRLSVDETAAMVRYAMALEDDEARALWLARLEAVDPANRLLLSSRLDDVAYVEDLWSVKGLREASVCEAGFQQAGLRSDDAAARRWALRCLSLVRDPDRVREMALALASDPETRERGIAAIRGLLADLDRRPPEDRPLDLTPSEDRIELNRRVAGLQVALAKQLLASGDPIAAIETLDSTDGLGRWMPDLYRTRLEAELAVADTAAAALDYLRLETDPVYPRAPLDSLRARMHPGAVRAEAAVQKQVASEWLERVSAEMDAPRGLADLAVTAPDGRSRTLHELVAGRPTLLLMWDRRILGNEEYLEEVHSALRIVGSGAAQLLWITPEPPSASLEAFRRRHDLPIPAYHDPHREVAETLGEWSSDSYFVIDRAGEIRARSHSLMEAVRRLEVLERLRNTA